ncbi:hypothetical protein N0V85_004943 [Neurospora sp. IMI 360204]|nr:hypothetical protein N0V85_004943 [Neurospora sp. IMI 360204]
MSPKRNKASSPGPVNSSKKLNGGGASFTIFKSRLQLLLAKESANMNKSTHQSQASTSPVLSTKKKATTKTTTIQVQPTTPPPPTSSNSSRPRRSSACLAVPSRLADSQILDLGFTDEDDEDDKDDEVNEDDDDDQNDDKGDDDDELHWYLKRLRGNSSTAFTMDNTFSMRPGKDDNNNKKYFDRWFITKPVPLKPRHSTAALVPTQIVQLAGTIPSTPARAPSNGSSSSAAAAFNVHGGLFVERAFNGRNLFPARRKKEDSDYYDMDPSDFNRLFEEAAKRDAAEKHMQLQLQLQLAVEEKKKKMLVASKELPAATHHSLPTRKSDLYFMDSSSK